MTELNTARSDLIAAILSLGTVEQPAPVIGALVAYIESLGEQKPAEADWDPISDKAYFETIAKAWAEGSE